ncbi:MAG TPA: cytochrome bc complex cytochrome b subunit [Bryobacteraceae bacterium]|nr:cytochrome bc complex cytochrome b subunit [Bryobacteraceae bacterium]
MLGEIALYSFVLLVLTGAFLAMFFNASSAHEVYHGSYKALDGVSVTAAYSSVLHISFDIPAGLLVRQMHHWASLVFVAAIVMHLARIFFTAAYRSPREINWIIGVTLLILVMGNGFLGYSIGGDVLSEAGVRIAYAILLSIPIFGQWLAFVFFGGVVPSDVMIPRMYALHIFLVPALIAILIAVHLSIIWRQKHTNYPGAGRTDQTIVGSRLWPSYALKSFGLCFIVFGVVAFMGAFVQINPVWIYGPATPTAILGNAQPDWYLGWIEGALRLFPGVSVHVGGFFVPEIFFPGVVFPALIFLFLYLYPFLDRWFNFHTARPHNVLLLPYQQPFNTALGCAVFVMLLVVFFAGSDDVIAIATGTLVGDIRTLLRILFFVAPAVSFLLAYSACALVRHHHARRVHRQAESQPAIIVGSN